MTAKELELRAALRHNNQRIPDSLKLKVAPILKDLKAQQEWQAIKYDATNHKPGGLRKGRG